MHLTIILGFNKKDMNPIKSGILVKTKTDWISTLSSNARFPEKNQQ
jgi:hypothetical protein